MTDADGQPIEVVGAPGPRTLLTYLLLHYDMPIESAFAKACDDEGLLLQDVYKVWTNEKGEVCAVLEGFWGKTFEEKLFCQEPRLDGQATHWLAMRCSIAELAVLLNDVWWRWPIPKDPAAWAVMHPARRSDVVGPRYASDLRSKIRRGMTAVDAFEELCLLNSGLTYTLSMPSEGRLRVVTNGWLDAWEGDF